MKLTPNQWTILEALERGPGWMRSFQTVKPLVEDLVGKGLIERCRPHLGRARNMIRLTAAGCDLLDIAPDVVPTAEPARPLGRATIELLPIKAGVSDRVRSICTAFVGAVKGGEHVADVIGHLAAIHGVQRPAIWRNLRAGGVLPPYKTGKPIPRSHSAPPNPIREPLRIVDRDPCPRCGVRGDIGCAHHRAEAAA